jgi:hypothetical protein
MADLVSAGLQPDGSASPQELERALRERLVGRRLVAEIGLDAKAHEAIVEAITQVLRRRNDPRLVGSAYPALLVCYLVGHGIYGYAQGAFWSTVTVSGIDDSFGPVFERAVRALGLETFEDMVAGDNAQRYVAPILAHGGIPKYSLDDLFKLVLKDAGKAADARDLIGLWRARKSAFFGVDKPVRRFLLYGGALGSDFLDRCLDLVQSYARTGTVPKPDEVGLPAHVVVGFQRFKARIPPELRRAHEQRWPRPQIRLDPWGSAGPELNLPPVDASGRVVWHLQADGQLDRVEASRHDPKTVRLRPSRSWTVSLLEDGLTLRETTFEGIEADEVPALFFEPASGRLVEVGAGLRADELWMLSPPQARIEGIGPEGAAALEDLGELPDPTGAWSGYRLRHVTLDGMRAVAVSMEGGRERRLTVRSPAGRPTLVGSPLAGVMTSEGMPVYPTLPEVAFPAGADRTGWVVRLTVGGKTTTVAAESLPGGPEGLALDSLCDAAAVATIDLLVRGTSLGSDLRVAFAYVPGLQVKRPDRLLLPGDREAAVEVSAKVPVRAGASSPLRLTPGPDDRELALDIPAADQPLRLSIALPRLLWGAAWTDQSTIELAGRKVVLGADDVAEGRATALVVRTGLPGLPLRLRLVAGGEVRQDTGPGAITSGDDGRWVFDLARFRDSVRTLEEPVAHLELEAGQWPVRVGEVRPALHVHDLRAGGAVIGGISAVYVQWTEDRLLRNRVVRLWSLDRPWEGPIAEAVADSASGVATITGHERFAVGSYLAELAIDDGWTSARWPASGSATVVPVKVGTPVEIRQRLEHLTLDDPLHVLEIALATGKISRRLDPAEFLKVAPAALKALQVMLVGDPAGTVTNNRFGAVALLLTANAYAFADACIGAVEAGECSDQDLLVLAVVLTGRLRPQDAKDIDDGRMRSLWEVAPALAAGLDLSTDPSESQLDRGREFLWDSDDGDNRQPPLGQPVEQVWIGMPAEQLALIRREVELVPRRALSLDTFIAATFEWLEAAKAPRSPVESWWELTSPLLRELGGVPAPVRAHLNARQAPVGAVAWAAVPAATLACVWHVLTNSRHAVRAGRALLEAVPFAPRLVARDLVLGRVLIQGWFES